MKYTQPLKACWLIILISFAPAIHGCAAKGSANATQQGAQVVLTKIETHDMDGKTEVTIEATEPILQYTSFQLSDPLRLVVDIADSSIGQLPDRIAVNSGGVTDITPVQKDSVSRLEFGLSQAVETKVYQSEGKLVVELSKPAEEAQAASQAVTPAPQPEVATSEAVTAPTTTPEAAPVFEKKEAAQPEQEAAKVVTAVSAIAGKEGVQVVITGDGAMKPNAFLVGTKKLVVDIPGVQSKVRPRVIPVRKGGLDRVRIGQHPAPDLKVRVVLDLTKTLRYTVTPQGNTVLIAMSVAPAIQAEQSQPQETAAVQEPEKPAITETEISAQTSTPAQQPVPPAAATPPVKEEHKEVAKHVAAPAETLLGAGGSRFTGRKISLDLQDADIVNVMRLFAEVANLNIILAPEVKGKVTVRMVNVPWDQAMSIILKMNGLGYALEDHVLRIAPVGVLAKEDEDEMRAKESKTKAEDLVTRIVPINYSTAATIEGTIKKSLSPRGETVTDARTNTLIIKDIERNVDQIVSLVKILDKPIPQIMIEARIVEATLTFSSQIGVQWGGNFQASAATGNPTGLQFPNTIGVTGGPTMGTTPSGNGNFIVNMPAAAGAATGGGAIGFQFGSLSKALNLDLVLSALESTGEGKVISSPKVSALDNKEAKIEQGLSIPFSTTSASGTQIQFIDAILALTVTPHVTPDGKIIMKIDATKNAPNTSILGASGQPSIQKNEASTEVLVTDGETAVIGGILTNQHTISYTKVPFFGDLPFIGVLFRTKTSTDNKDELLIFITPRIVRQEAI
ncbi:MAG TPA: type IV pilus secretin PilQ [Nitrospirota bacterium]|nr:type IV pilus secretin PilQ [Nitrospirota bacterium]